MLLKGSAASHGEVTGTARVVLSLDEIENFKPGDILVTVATSPAWTPLMHASGGIVTETGGVLSHAAIVSREYSIPAVVAIPGVTKKIKDGQTVRVNGTLGTVEIVK
ncbi:MAG: PEP-utilizing enzyme [Patescibacteria group bacterium]